MGADDTDALATFSAFLEFNLLRAAVRNGWSFEESLKAPLNLDSLKAERSAKMSGKRDRQKRVGQLETVDSELEWVLEELLFKQDCIEELERLHEERAELIRERDTQRRQVETTETAISRLESELEQVENRIADAEARAADHGIESLRSEKERLEQQVAEPRNRLEVL